MPRLIRRVLAEGPLRGRALSVDSGIDVIGDIAIVRLVGIDSAVKHEVADALLASMTNVKCVFEQEGGVEGEYRLRKLVHLAGDDRLQTTHRENGCAFEVDLGRCYFSPRLSTERKRIAERVSPGESVLNMFAGVGPFSIPISRMKRVRVTSCELNEVACAFHEKNNRLNKVAGLIRVLNEDAAELPRLLGSRFDRILMPHPTKANEFLPAALALSKKGATIHYYRQVLGRNELEARAGLREELTELLPAHASYEIHRVREIGPRWLELAADIVLKD